MYPPEPEVKEENSGNIRGSFLDLSINIEDNISSIVLFDKGDSFLSSIVRITHLISNIKPKIFYADMGQKY